MLGRRGVGPLYRVRAAVDRVYEVSEARDWIEPAVNDAPGRLMFAYRRPRETFMTQLNERFGLTHLRQMDTADLQASEDREADFDRFVDDSLLPLMLRDAAGANVPLVLRPRAAPARVAAARPPSRPRCDATSRSCAATSRRTGRCSTTTPAIRR